MKKFLVFIVIFTLFISCEMNSQEISFQYIDSVINKGMTGFDRDSFIGKTINLSQMVHESHLEKPFETWSDGVLVDADGEPIVMNNNEKLIASTFTYRGIHFLILGKKSGSSNCQIVDAVILQKKDEKESLFSNYPTTIDDGPYRLDLFILAESFQGKTENANRVFFMNPKTEKIEEIQFNSIMVFGLY